MKKVLSLSLLAFGGFSLLTSCKGNAQQQGEQAPPELAVMAISEDATTLETGFPATLQGENDVEIRPQISGFLIRVCVKEGQKVSKGQVLFEIDQVSLKAAVDAAQAAVAVAQANVNTATTNANNNKILLDKNIIGAPAYQTSVDQLNAAKAQLNQAQANLTSARKNLSYSIVTAPVAGVVGTIANKEGSLVSPQTLLTILSENGDMQASFSLNEKDVLALTDNGQRSLKTALESLPSVTLLLANGERYPEKGRIVSVSGVLDPSTGSASVKAIFPNPNGMLQSGYTGQVLIPNVHNNAMMIPQSATFEVQDMKFVYVVNDSSIVRSTPIKIDSQNDGQNYIVTEGLKIGDKIVTEGVGITVKDGMTIKPKVVSR
ncbi:MAG: efflux RND transporter periplasmic adaptor subunit [Muribaculaceae bacterium]|nr:efflux RND transporter periplasmic adaptor subunit [Muribaculaceae bacterium]